MQIEHLKVVEATLKAVNKLHEDADKTRLKQQELAQRAVNRAKTLSYMRDALQSYLVNARELYEYDQQAGQVSQAKPDTTDPYDTLDIPPDEETGPYKERR